VQKQERSKNKDKEREIIWLNQTKSYLKEGKI
jgi:hypothetical protein